MGRLSRWCAQWAVNPPSYEIAGSIPVLPISKADVVKLVDTQDLGSCAFGRGGSNPSFRIMETLKKWYYGGLFLLKLGWPIRYNRKSPYARLRFEIMYGDPSPKITWKLIKQMIDYGYWAHNFKRKYGQD